MTTADAPTLRVEIERRRDAGERFTMKQTVALMVPLITRVAEAHHAGERFILTPSSIRYVGSGAKLDLALASATQSSPRDRACLAPELRGHGTNGDESASVFSIGAILYELVTMSSIGPGMRRPGEIVATVPDAFEALLAKALVSEPAHRPADLAALAQALHRCAPGASMPPPPADESHLDHDGSIDVDLNLSMLPPAPEDYAARRQVQRELQRLSELQAQGQPIGPFATKGGGPGTGGGGPASDASRTTPRKTGATSRLAEMKERLEADPRSRYVVLRDGMDHGPFTAVELLKQLAQEKFNGEHVLRDVLSGDERPISEWSEFALFVEHTRLGKEHSLEREKHAASVVADATKSQFKTLIAAGISVIAIAALAGAYYRLGRDSADDLTVTGDRAHAVDVDGELAKAKAKAQRGGPRGAVGAGVGAPDGEPGQAGTTPAGSYPQVPDGLSCAGAQARYVEDYSKDAPPDLTQGAYAGVLSRGTYLNSCGVPPSMSVVVCAAVQNGRAVGVTVSTTPPNGGISKCISGQIRSMAFPAHPRLDVATTSFAAQ
ncbi:MAG: hypothetical protein EXR75_04170 [Myxococcales bacterium]|nr:hypothetical protein [Myxococcales bacterium]